MSGFTNLWLPDEVLAAFPPDRDELCRFVSAGTSDAALLSIATSDSWADPHDEYMELRWHRDGGEKPPRSRFGESLTFFLYRRFDDPSQPLDLVQFQMARAFCACRWLDRSPKTRDVFADPHGYAFPALMEASDHLGREFRFAFARLLTWSLERIGSNDPEYVSWIWALFAVAAYETSTDDPDALLLARWIDRLSDEFAPDRFPAELSGYEFRYWYVKPGIAWRRSAALNLRDRLPLESELRYELERVLETEVNARGPEEASSKRS